MEISPKGSGAELLRLWLLVREFYFSIAPHIDFNGSFMTPDNLLRRILQFDDPRQERRCLLITFGFQCNSLEAKNLSVLTLVTVTVIAWKFATGDWSVAAGFGSLVAGLIGIALMDHKKSEKPKEKQS